MNRRDKLAEDLLRIRKCAFEVFVFWMGNDEDRNRDILRLKEIRDGQSYPSLKNKASVLLEAIDTHLNFVAALKDGDQVQVMQTFDKVPKGSIGRYVCKLTPKLSLIALDINPSQKRSTLTLLLFPPEQEAIQTVFQKTAIDSISDVSETALPVSASTDSDSQQRVQDMLLEPNPKLSEEIPMGRPKGSRNKPKGTTPAEQPPMTPVDGQKKKRGRPVGRSKAEKSERQLEQETNITTVGPVPTAPAEEPVNPTEEVHQAVPAEGSSSSSMPEAIPETADIVSGEPVDIQSESAEKPVPEQPKAIIVRPNDHREEIFLIRDALAFSPGFLFAKNVEGARRIYIVMNASNRIVEKRTLLNCCVLTVDQAWKSAIVMYYEPPKLFMKEEDRYYYLTSQEYKQVYTTNCFVGLPIPSAFTIQDVLDTYALYQKRIVELLRMYASQHAGFSMKNEVLAVFARLAKHNQLDYQCFESIIQIVFSDDPPELENILRQFKQYLGCDVTEHPRIQSLLAQVTDRIRQQDRLDKIQKRINTLLYDLPKLSEEQLSVIEDRLKNY